MFGASYVHYDPAGGDLHRFATVTTEPNAATAPIHNRMPAILGPDLEAAWLDPATRALELQLLLGPYPSEAMEAYPVRQLVNHPLHDSPDVVAPTGG